MGNYGTFGLDSNYDMSLDSGGNLNVVYDTNSIIQNVTSAIRLWYGEYEFNTVLGVNYYNYFGNLVTLMNVKIQRDVTNAILSVSGVSTVESLTYNYDAQTGALSGVATITIANGVTTPVQF